MTADPMPPLPTPEHARLDEAVGRWVVECTYFLGPDQPPMRATAQDTIARLGPYWTVSDFRSEMMGAPFAGRATVGFDPVRKKWISTWVDSMSPFLFVLEGEFCAAGKVLTMHCDGTDAAGMPARFRTREEHLTKDHRVLQMFRLRDDGEPVRMFEFVYRRAK